MSAVVTAGEVAQMAIEAEKIGTGLYKSLAEATRSAQAKEYFEWIEEDEEEDVRELQQLSEALNGSQPAGEHPEDFSRYLRILWETKVFKDGETCREMIENAWDAAEAARLAAIFQREIILFLHELRRCVPEAEQMTVDRLLDGEYRHLRLLYALEAVSRPSSVEDSP
jgi:rubrerythrin